MIPCFSAPKKTNFRNMLKTSSSFPSACFRPAAAIIDDDNDMNPSSSSTSTVSPPPPTSGKPNVTSCVYQTTELGLISFTWYTNLIGRSLQIHFQSPSHSNQDISTASPACCFDLHIQPFLFWRPKNGSKTFNLMNNKDSSSKTVQIYWNFSKAKFSSDHPEPKSGFYVTLILDGVMILLVGDSPNQAYNKTKTDKNKKNHKQQQVLVLRREHVFASRFYTTKVRFGGKTRDISIDCRIGDGEEARLCFSIDGEKVIEIKRLKWKFRGNQRIEIDGKYPIHISWDVYNWLFESQSSSSSPGGVGNGAVFMFRFENPFENEDEEEHMIDDEKVMSGNMISCGFGINNFGLKKRSASSPLSSSMSSSVSSSSCTSSVMEWANMEDTELDTTNKNGPPGFSLLIYAWKK